MNDLAVVDLNLLVALDALLEESHVTRAAKRSGITQPAMSNALMRLRRLFDDPLLVRAEGGMQLTPRAERLRAPLRLVLRQIREQILRADAFTPRSTQA